MAPKFVTKRENQIEYVLPLIIVDDDTFKMYSGELWNFISCRIFRSADMPTHRHWILSWLGPPNKSGIRFSITKCEPDSPH